VSAELAFQLLNAVVLPWWAVWLAAPRSPLAGRMAGHGGIFIVLGLVYFGLATAAVTLEGSEGFAFDDLRTVLAAPIGFLTGWTHFLAFDLFVGAWIVRESGRLGLEPRPYLFFTLMAGPIGLLGFLLRRTVHLRSAGQLGGTDLV
jgi:hypothetical protein